MYHAIIDENNKVVNVVLWDGKSVWSPGPALKAIPCYAREGSIGDTYDPETNQFIKPT